MKHLSLRIAVGLLTFIFGISTSYLLDSHPSKHGQGIEQQTATSLDGVWVMGNASGGNEAGTLIRIVQQGQNVTGIIEQPSTGYGADANVKKGDVEFEGTFDGNVLRGQVHSYSGLEYQQTCHDATRFILKDFETTLTLNGNLLLGWTQHSMMNSAGCTTRIAGRTTYTFSRISQ